MSGRKLKLVMALMAVAMIVLFPLVATASEVVTITGEINDDFQIVDGSGQLYEIADTIAGNELVENHIGEKAKVTGTLDVDQGFKIITVTQFELLAD